MLWLRFFPTKHSHTSCGVYRNKSLASLLRNHCVIHSQPTSLALSFPLCPHSPSTSHMPNIPDLLQLHVFAQAVSSAGSTVLLCICPIFSFSSNGKGPSKLSHLHPRLWWSSSAQSLFPVAGLEHWSPYVLNSGLNLSCPFPVVWEPLSSEDCSFISEQMSMNGGWSELPCSGAGTWCWLWLGCSCLIKTC